MDVFYINLARRPDRKERFLRLNRGVARFHRVKAIDGRTVNRRQLMKQGVVREPLEHYTPGALGCALSHKKLWDRCASGTLPLTVAEDDAVFNRCFSEKAAVVVARLSPDWDIILWGWNFDSVLHVGLVKGIPTSIMHFDAASVGERWADFQAQHFEVLPMRLINAFGNVCYSITPQGAQKLCTSCFPLRNELFWVEGLRHNICNFGIDSIMNKYYRNLRAYVCFPPLVWTENDKKTSDVACG
jgi:GR25 family glycosyltransferase involved in LPS biosynthesis